MKKLIHFLAICILLSPLAACSTMTHADTGTIGGAVLGGLAGSAFGSGGGRIAAATGGAMIGAFLGNRIGSSMDQADRDRVYNAIENNKVGQTKRWHNPNSGIDYTVTPTRTSYKRLANGSSQPCREYTTTATIGGKKQQVYGRACRMADGSWRVKS